MDSKRAVILGGHGGVPSDCPPELVGHFKREEALAKGRPSPGLAAADAELRAWPRTDSTDPYGAGLRSLLAALKAQLPGHEVVEAYNEFCPPTLEQALAAVIGRGTREVTVLSTMYTRGGLHSEKEIPALLEAERLRHAGVVIRYVWPYSLEAVSGMLAQEVLRTEK